MTCPSDKNEVTAAMNRKSSRRERGFTILEIVIVFVLLAGIMAFVGPRIFAKLGQAKSAEQRIRTQSLVGDIEMYKLEVGRYPDNLQSLVKQPAGLDRWNGPYAKAEDLKDAWGNDYRYTFPGQSKPFDLLSLGADNKEGGEGEDRDVTN
jgi:general secretion pathway protein G